MNDGLLRFVAAVHSHEKTQLPLSRFTNYDQLEMDVAVNTAVQRGLIELTNQRNPCVRLTCEGKAWARKQMAPFDSLIDLLFEDKVEVAL